MVELAVIIMVYGHSSFECNDHVYQNHTLLDAIRAGQKDPGPQMNEARINAEARA